MPLTLWIDPSDDSVVTFDSPATRITAIADKSTSGNDVAEQASPQSGPSFSSTLVLPARKRFMTFGAGEFLRRVNASPALLNMGGPDFTVIVAFSDDGSNGLDGGLVGVSDPSSPLDASGWRIDKPLDSPQTARITASVGDRGTNFIDVETAPSSPLSSFAAAGQGVVSLTFKDGEYLIAHMNGAEISAIPYTGTLGFAHDLNIGMIPGGASWESGRIYEVLYCDEVLTSDERQRAEAYLAHKWWFANSLDTGHPFRLRAPDLQVNAEFIANFDGTDGAVTFTSEDFGTRVGTFAGNAQLDTADQKFGTASLLLDGSGDYVTFPQSTDFDFAAGDFSIECWVRWSTDPSTSSDTFVSKYVGTGSNRSWVLQLSSNNLRFIYTTAGVTDITMNQSWNPEANQWYHVCVERYGNLMYHYVNGVQRGTALSMTDTIFTASAVLDVGSRFTTGQTDYYGPGWIDGMRIVKGQALHRGASSFLLPYRAPVRTFPAALIANFNGASGGTSYTSEDSGARVATFGGGAVLDTGFKKFGASSLDVRAASPEGFVTFPDSADFDFTTIEFTIECWVYFDNDPGTNQMTFVSKWGPTNQNSWWLGLDTGGTTLALYFSTSGGNAPFNSVTFDPTAGQWYHVAVVRDAAVVRFYVDGVQLGNTANNFGFFSSTRVVEIGSYNSGVSPFDGWIDGVRVVAGVALYRGTTAFTPPNYPPGEPIF